MNIIFDMGGTIIKNINTSFEKGFISLYPYIYHDSNTTISSVSFLIDAMDITYDLFSKRNETMIEVSFERILEQLNKLYLFTITIEKQQEIFINNFETIAAIDGIIPFLEMLKSHHINCYVLSNSTFSSKYLVMQLQKVGLSDYFKDCISSADVGYRKPHPLFFNYLINKYQLDISDTIMIGNDFEKDILGATKIGLKAYFFTNNPFSYNDTNIYTFNKYSDLSLNLKKQLK